MKTARTSSALGTVQLGQVTLRLQNFSPFTTIQTVKVPYLSFSTGFEVVIKYVCSSDIKMYNIYEYRHA